MNIIILSLTFRKCEEALLNAALERGHNALNIDPSNVTISIENEKITLNEIQKSDRILIRRTAEKPEQVSSITTAIEKLNIPCLERPFHYASSSVSKINALLRRSSQVKVPKTWVIWRREQLDKISPSLSWPILFKPNQGYGGKGILRINDFQELEKFANIFFKEGTDSALLLQKELKRKREYRVLVLNGSPLATVLKCANSSDLVANAAAGISFHDARAADILPDEIHSVEEIAVYASTNVHRLIFSGVDVLVDENDEVFILECNRNPQFIETQRAVPNVNISDKVIECLEKPEDWM